MALLKLLLLLLGLVNSDSVSLQKRIIGGHDSRDNERQYHVVIYSFGNFICGGSLISSRWILTAAHCAAPLGLTAGLGEHPVNNNQIPNNNQHSVLDRIEMFGPFHDIVMVRLQTPTTIRPVQLPDCKTHPLRVRGRFQLAGHAATRTDTNDERVPMDHLPCVDMFVYHINRRDSKGGHIFTVYAQSRDIRHDDSGGGVVHKDKIYGVISTGGEKAFHKLIGVMDVCEYMPWINQVLAGL